MIRESKLKELEKYINELKTIKLEKTNNVNNFLKIEQDLGIINETISQDKLFAKI